MASSDLKFKVLRGFQLFVSTYRFFFIKHINNVIMFYTFSFRFRYEFKAALGLQ